MFTSHIIQICSGITRGILLNEELYTQNPIAWREIFMKQSVQANANKLTSRISVFTSLYLFTIPCILKISKQSCIVKKHSE